MSENFGNSNRLRNPLIQMADAEDPVFLYDASLNCWLQQRLEEPLLPMLPIIDPHHHLWAAARTPAHGQPISAATRNCFGARCGLGKYEYGDFLSDTAANGVVASIFIECGMNYDRAAMKASRDHLAPVAETAGVAEIARSAKLPLYIIGHVDFTLGADIVRECLSKHIETGEGRFKGVRSALAWDLSDELYSTRQSGQQRDLSGTVAFREGFAVLSEFGLIFESWLYHPQIKELAALARAFPSTTIVLNHVGFPLGAGPWEDPEKGNFGRRGPSDAVIDDWKAAIRDIASCQNVVCKLSGLTMPVTGFGWERDGSPPSSAEIAWHLAPFYLIALEAFGPDRCMFASNFPPDKASCSYTVLWNAMKRIALRSGLSEDAIRGLFSGNAARVYGISLC